MAKSCNVARLKRDCTRPKRGVHRRSTEHGPEKPRGPNAHCTHNPQARNINFAEYHPEGEIAMALSTELAEKVEALYREHLAREFGD